MAYVVGFISQKGGVGKSTLARLLARELAAGGMSVKVADLDMRQGTTFKWAQRREAAGIEPPVSVEKIPNVEKALSEAEQYDAYIIDALPYASIQSFKIAEAADVVFMPTAQSVDDLEPTVLLAHDLVQEGIPTERIAIALCKTTDSKIEVEAARQYVSEAGYTVLPGQLPFKTALVKALDAGKAVTETPFPSVRAKADQLAQSLVDAVAQAGQRRAA